MVAFQEFIKRKRETKYGSVSGVLIKRKRETKRYGSVSGEHNNRRNIIQHKNPSQKIPHPYLERRLSEQRDFLVIFAQWYCAYYYFVM